MPVGLFPSPMGPTRLAWQPRCVRRRRQELPTLVGVFKRIAGWGGGTRHTCSHAHLAWVWYSGRCRQGLPSRPQRRGPSPLGRPLERLRLQHGTALAIDSFVGVGGGVLPSVSEWALSAPSWIALDTQVLLRSQPGCNDFMADRLPHSRSGLACVRILLVGRPNAQ